MASGEFKILISKSEWDKMESVVRGLDKIDGNRAIMNSLSKGMARVVSKGKSNLTTSNKTKTGNLKKSMTRKQVKKWMSVYGGFRKGKNGGNHAHLVDRGTDERWQYKTGRYTGSVSRGKPNTGTRFWTRAVEAEGPKIMETTMNVIYDEVAKIIRKRK